MKYNNTYHRSTKIKPADVKPGMYIEYGFEHNKKLPKTKVDDPRQKNIFRKVYTANCSEELFLFLWPKK